MKKIIFFCLFFAVSNVFSQKNSGFNKFAHLSSAQGLSQNSVLSIEQDELDRVWIGTRDGLNRYDGEKITVYRNIPGDSTSITNNDIRCIQKDKNGFLWIGTQKGLNRYNPRNNTFSNFFYKPGVNSLINNRITAITQLKNGDLWIGTAEGLSIYDIEKKEFINYRSRDFNKQSLSSDFITEIYQDTNDVVWVGTTAGLNKALNTDKTNLVFQRFYLNASNKEEKGFIQTLQESPEGMLWVGTRDNGLATFNTCNNVFELPETSILNGITSKDIRSLCYDNEQNLWIATYDGLYIITNTNSVVHITHQYGNSKSLSRNTLKKIFVDNQGSVWVGAYYGGANIWDPYRHNFDTVFRVEANKAYSLGVVSSIAEDIKGNLYFGTEGTGVTVIDKDKKTNFRLTKALNAELKDVNVKSLLIHGSKLWIGTFNKGVKCFDLNLERFEDFQKTNNTISKLLENIGLYSIVRIDDLIVFGTFGQGVVVYNLKTKKINVITSSLYGDASLTNNRVRVLFVDKNKDLWVGTESGLNKIAYSEITSEKQKVKRFLFDSEHYFGSDITSILQSENGAIYVGTKENGFFVHKEGDFKLINLNTQNTKINTICSIVEDDKNNLWISSNYGILKYNVEVKDVELFSQIDGLVGQEFNNNSGKKINTGEVYFGGVFGASFFNPLLVDKRQNIPKVIFTDLKVQGEEISSFNDPESVLKQSISYTKKIKLSHSQSSFSLNFAMPNYGNVSSNKYKYRLVGLDKIWKYSNTPEVNYSIQKPGKFIFEVQGVTDTNHTPTRLEIEVMRAPWKSLWAFVIYFIIIALALFAFNQIKESRSKLKHRLELQSVEKQQQQALNKSKLEFFTNISHEFRTPLSLILGPLQQVIDDYQGSNKVYKKLLVIQQNGDQLLKLINQLLDFRKYENEHSRLQVAEGNIVKFLKEIYLSFFEFSKIGNYKYSFNASSEEIRLYFDRYKLERVFYNLISNAFKYTPEGGVIEVDITFNEKSVFVAVKDNGKGVDKKFVDKIFDRFYEVAGDKKYQKQFNQASGIGLSIAKKAIALHKGEISILDTQEQGATFVVSLPKGKDHLVESNIVKDFKVSDDLSLYKLNAVPVKTRDLDLNFIDKDEDKPLVLIAEDNDALRNFIADILNDSYRVIKTENGKEAFKKALQHIPDLIISDVIMPEMEGTELCAKIKADIRTSHIPLILLTSRTSLVYKFDGLESGADGYINKPFDVREFLLTTKNILNSKQKIKEKFSVENIDINNNSVTGIDEQLLQKAVVIVTKNIDNPSFNIPHFCTELGVSRTILFAKIKGLTNLTPNEFIHSIRMKRASQLLELGQINVSEVCYRVGFKNPKYFTKCFKKHFNQTPTEYAAKFYL